MNTRIWAVIFTLLCSLFLTSDAFRIGSGHPAHVIKAQETESVGKFRLFSELSSAINDLQNHLSQLPTLINDDRVELHQPPKPAFSPWGR